MLVQEFKLDPYTCDKASYSFLVLIQYSMVHVAQCNSYCTSDTALHVQLNATTQTKYRLDRDLSCLWDLEHRGKPIVTIRGPHVQPKGIYISFQTKCS